MNTRRMTTAGVALVAAFGLGLAGCGNDASNGSAGPSASATSATSAAPEPSPLEALSAAAQKLNEQPFKIDFAMTGVNGKGAVDPTTKKLQMTMGIGAGNQAMSFDLLAVEEEFYLRLKNVPQTSGKWLHINARKLADNSQLGMMRSGDPLGTNNLIQGVSDVERNGEGSYQGTLDLTKSTSASAQSLKTLGDKAKAVPFTAKVDEEGRLTEFVVDLESLQAGMGQMKTTYSEFGTPVTVERPPASEVQEAPADVLRALGG